MCLVGLVLFVINSIFVAKTSALNMQDLLSSPCPMTFQYEKGLDGVLRGHIKIYSFDDNVVQLNVELSVGNAVENYNGHIDLARTKDEVIDDVLHRRPVEYKVHFPRWERIPPRVARILVNGRLVCSGPKLQMNGLVSVLTTVNLQHILTIKVQPLFSIGNNNNNPTSQNNFFVENKNKPEVVFLPAPPTSTTNVNTEVNPNGNVEFNPNIPTEYTSNPFLTSFLTNNNNKPGATTKNPFISLGSTTTKPNVNVIINELPTVPKNPFLNANVDAKHPSGPAVPPTKFPPVMQVDRNKFPSANEPPPKINGGGMNELNAICGLTVVSNPLVVKGSVVPRGSFPWLVAMFYVNSLGLEYKCSGSLISHKHVVTAAHCVKKRNVKIRPNEILMVLGKLNIQRWALSDGEKLIEAYRIHVHSDYMPSVSDADIAVVELNEEVQFTNFIRPICLWSGDDNLVGVVGKLGKVVGWGKDENGDISTAEPKQTTLPIVSQEQCLWSGETFKYVTSNRTFCAGYRNGSGPCNGDSGSGFVMKEHNRWMLRGVVSASTYDAVKQSCDLSNYVVFTDASKFKLWLLSFILEH